MRFIPRRFLVCALILIFFGSACGVLTKAFPTRKAASPRGQTRLPATSANPNAPSTGQLIPITGENVVFMQCQFCAGGETHAVLIFPETAYFDVEQTSAASCLTANVVKGRRIVICRGAQGTTFLLNICSDPSNCLQFPVALQPCALLQGSVTTFPPVFLTPISRHKSNNGDGSVPPASTQTTLPPANPPELTQPPRPTKEPKPTHEPKPTKPPKPTKVPKPHKHKH